MKKSVVILIFSLLISGSVYAKKPGGSSSWQSGNTGHQLGCLIISLLGIPGCEKPKNEAQTNNAHQSGKSQS